MSRLLVRIALIGVSLVAAPFAITAAPLCSGTPTITALGSAGCQLGDVTFSNFTISDVSVIGSANADGANPDHVHVAIELGTLLTDPLGDPSASVPAVQLTFTPSDPALWTVNPSSPAPSLSFTLSYSVATASPDHVFEQYQVRGANLNLGNTWTIAKDVTNGSATVTASAHFPTPPPATFARGTTAFDVSDRFSVFTDVLYGGKVTSFTNAFTLVPEPGTALLMLGGLAGIAASRRA